MALNLFPKNLTVLVSGLIPVRINQNEGKPSKPSTGSEIRYHIKVQTDGGKIFA